MNENDIYSVDFSHSLPPPLKEDPEMNALARVISEQLQRTAQKIRQNIIYARIDELDEQLLDILAYDLHVDWYDYNHPLEAKRAAIKNSVQVHKRLGTKYAIETALAAIYPEAKVSEWFEYDGEPYRFRLHINTTGMQDSLDRQKRALNTLGYCKNVRSHLDVIQYTIDLPPETLYLGGAVGVITELGIPEKANSCDFRRTLHLGGAVGVLAEIGAPEQLSTYNFRHSLRVGGAAGMHASTGTAEAPNNPDFTGTVRVGGNTGTHTVYTIPQNTAPPPFSIRRNGGVCTITMQPPEGS